MMPTQARTMTTQRGRSVTSILMDREALALCATLTQNSFAQDLVEKYARGLSRDQMTWVHILAMEEYERRTQPTVPSFQVGNMAAILALFSKAGSSLKRPKIRLLIKGQKLAITRSSKGYLNVTDGLPYGESTYFGKIEEDGTFRERQHVAGLRELLLQFAADPAGVATEYGRLTGHCCFCDLKLEDERSTEVGYGQKCAANYGLPWGATGTKPSRKARAVTRAFDGPRRRATADDDGPEMSAADRMYWLADGPVDSDPYDREPATY